MRSNAPQDKHAQLIGLSYQELLSEISASTVPLSEVRRYADDIARDISHEIEQEHKIRRFAHDALRDTNPFWVTFGHPRDSFSKALFWGESSEPDFPGWDEVAADIAESFPRFQDNSGTAESEPGRVLFDWIKKNQYRPYPKRCEVLAIAFGELLERSTYGQEKATYEASDAPF